MGRNSGLEEDRDDLLLDEFELVKEMDEEDDWLQVKCLIGRSKKSHIVMDTRQQTIYRGEGGLAREYRRQLNGPEEKLD